MRGVCVCYWPGFAFFQRLGLARRVCLLLALLCFLPKAEACEACAFASALLCFLLGAEAVMLLLQSVLCVRS